MKAALLTVLAIAMVVFAASGSLAQGKFMFGVGVDAALPIASGFSDTQNFGIGGTARGYYSVEDMITLTATAGYITFGGKEYTVAGQTVKAGSWNMVPVLVGARYYFSPASSDFRPYGAFEMGLIFGSYTVPSQTLFGITVGGGSVSTTDFSYQPALGFEASQFDVAVRLLGVSGATSIAARVGYIFN
jgi:hypothetical protein